MRGHGLRRRRGGRAGKAPVATARGTDSAGVGDEVEAADVDRSCDLVIVGVRVCRQIALELYPIHAADAPVFVSGFVPRLTRAAARLREAVKRAGKACDLAILVAEGDDHVRPEGGTQNEEAARLGTRGF